MNGKQAITRRSPRPMDKNAVTGHELSSNKRKPRRNSTCVLLVARALGTFFLCAFCLNFYYHGVLFFSTKEQVDDTLRNQLGEREKHLDKAPIGQDPEQTATQSHRDVDIVFVMILSMERSGSTHLAHSVLTQSHPCAIDLNEVWNPGISSGDAWFVDEGKELLKQYDDVRQVPPYFLVQFLLAKAKRECRKWTALEDTCGGKCLVAYKEFTEHLNSKQHSTIWDILPNFFVPVVLERNVEDRWKSKWIAHKTGDWNLKGSAEHKKKIAQEKVPPVTYSSSKELCDMQASNPNIWGLCRFSERHQGWYTMVRNAFPIDDRVEISFQDAVTNGGQQATDKIIEALPEDFYHWWYKVLEENQEVAK